MQSLNDTIRSSESLLIYVDHTCRFERNTGIQRCVRSLARAFQELGVSLQPVIWNRSLKCLEPANTDHRIHLSKWNGPSKEKWADGSIPLSKRIFKASWLIIPELVSGPFNPSGEDLLRVSKQHAISVVWLFHDAIPVRFPHFYGLRGNRTYMAHYHYMKDLASFDLVLANSETTARHLKKLWDEENLTPKAQLETVPLAEEFPGAKRLPETLEGTIVLCVSSLEPRKNHCALMKGFVELVASGDWPPDLYLVLAGWPNDLQVVNLVERALQLGLPLRWEKEASDERLLELYSKAIFCVFPSLEEGYGLPVAESIWHHRPCLCSNNGAISELALAGGCLMVNTSKWREIRDGMKCLITDKDLLAKLQHDISNRPLRLWKDVASRWLDLMYMQD